MLHLRPERFSSSPYQAKCSVDGCGDTVRVLKNKLCVTHYNRLRSTGRITLQAATRPCERCGKGMNLAKAATVIQKFCGTKCQSADKRARVRSKDTSETVAARATAAYRYKLKQYGLSEEDYFRLLRAQGDSCAVCRKHKSELPNGLYVDHDHATGKVRGLLCRGCNSGLGHFSDSLPRMEAAIAYLKQWTTE